MFDDAIRDMNNASIEAFSNGVVLIDERAVDAIFDQEYLNAFDTEHSKPQLSVVEGSYPWIEQDMRALVRNEPYTISSVQPDGTGLVIIQLEAR